MLGRIAAVTALALASAPITASTDLHHHMPLAAHRTADVHYDQLYVYDDDFNRSSLPTPQRECASIEDWSWPPIIGPIFMVDNFSYVDAELFTGAECTGESLVATAQSSIMLPYGIEFSHYRTMW